jgi:alanine racemase
MEVGAPLLQIRELAPGESAGYGRAFTAKRPTRVGIVGTGYADGYARSFSGRGVLMLRGRRVPAIGRVCMGMLLIDASDAPDAHPGDTAWILEGPGENPVRIHELARLWNSIGYEIFCLLGRNGKQYLS